MAAAQLAWSHRLRTSFKEMGAAVTEVAGISLPHPSLQAKTPLIRKIHGTVLRKFFSYGSSRKDASASRSEYALFVTDFTCFLTAVLTQLARFGSRCSDPAACSAQTAAAEQDVFWGLWQCLVAACIAFGSVTERGPPTAPQEQIPSCASLYTAFHLLLTWLLTMSRSPTWIAMKQQHGLHSRNRELVSVLEQPIKCVAIISMKCFQDLHSQLQTLPPAFLPMLCCIVSEQFSSAPSIVARVLSAKNVQAMCYRQGLATAYTSLQQPLDHILVQLCSSTNNFIFHAQKRGYSAPLAFLRAPAVSQMLKLMLVRFSEGNCDSDLAAHVIPPLNALLRQQILNPQPVEKESLPGPDIKSNRDNAGLPVHLNSLLSRPALDTDTKLLHVLSNCANRHTGFDPEILEIQCLILESWQEAGRELPHLSPEVVSVMMRNVVGLAKQCALCALQVMQQYASKKKQRPSKIHATDVQAILRGTRALMYATSMFQIRTHAPSGRVHLRSGPDFIKLLMWCMTCGRAGAAEALHRIGCQIGQTSTLEAKNVTLLSIETVTMWGGGNIIPELQAYVSLAGTIRKLLWFHLQRGTLGQQEERQHTWLACKPAKGVWLEQQREKCDNLHPHGLVQRLMVAIKHLDTLLGGGNFSRHDGFETGHEDRQGSRSIGTMSVITATLDFRTTSERGDKQKVHNVQSRTFICSEDEHPEVKCSSNTSHKTLLCLRLLQQLQAITLTTLVQICLWKVEFDLSQANSKDMSKIPEWLVAVQGTCKQIHNPELKLVVTTILNKATQSAPMQQPEVDAMWDEYSMTHLCGKLLPGCCHLGCTSLEAVGEMAMKTQLCSGCRKARYCSVTCQRSAWLKGGHGAVCGK